MPTPDLFDVASSPEAYFVAERFEFDGGKLREVRGERYAPVTDDLAMRESGLASWYGRKFHGRSTASGEVYDMYAMTAAHPTLPIPSYVRVTNVAPTRSPGRRSISR